MLRKIKNIFKKLPLLGSLLLRIRDGFLELKLAFERNALKRQYPLRHCGVNQYVPVVVSLTTIAPRLKMVPLCLRTLLSQSFRPDKVILWLSEYDVNGKKVISKGQLPKELLDLKKKGLEIRFCKDIGSYTKLIPALKEFPDAVIVTADDDCFYPKDWLQRLFESYNDDKKSIHCYQPRLISFKKNGEIQDYLKWSLDFDESRKSLFICPLGVNGVLYPPKVFNDEVFNEDVFLKICPKADDIWFKAMSLLNNTYCKKVSSESQCFLHVPGSQVISLFSENEYRNDEQIRAVFSKYGLFEKLFAQEVASDE